MSTLENHWRRRMLARLGGQHKLQVITKLGTSSLPSRLSAICLRGAVAQQVGLTCIVAKPASYYICRRGFHSKAHQYLKTHNPKICGLTPFQSIFDLQRHKLTCRTSWLLNYYRYERTKVRHKHGCKESSLGHGGLSNSDTPTSCNFLAWITNTTV